MSLSIPALQALRSVAETGSFAAAARQLGLTAPGVSQHVRNLEKTYDVQLFTRSNGQLLATPLCERVCDSADRMLLEQKALERMMRHHGSLKNGELSVGLGNAMPGMALVAAFNKNFPDVPLRVKTGSFQKIMRAVLDHSVDVGILPNIPKDKRFRRKVLLVNHVVAIVPPKNPLARKSEVTAKELMDERLIFRADGSSTQKVVDRYFRGHGFTPSAYLTLDTRDGVYEAVANGMGVGFVWKTSTGRGDDVAQITLTGGSTTSEEVVFFPIGQQMQTLDAFFNLVDQIPSA
ncbi:MAG: LysR family transcriptional regulator [Pseudomonadota bacterium]